MGNNKDENRTPNDSPEVKEENASFEKEDTKDQSGEADLNGGEEKNLNSNKEDNNHSNENQVESEDNDQNEEEDSGDSNNSDEIEKMKKNYDELNDKFLRLLAEFDNFRRRTAKEKLELRKIASADIMSDLLPVLDDFDRALKIIEDGNKSDSVAEGVKLVHQKLLKSLNSKGLSEMISNGEEFDPEWHEAVTEVPAPTKKQKGLVIDTVEKGYFLNDKIIRHAKVVVGK